VCSSIPAGALAHRYQETIWHNLAPRGGMPGTI
jgi:hypothetical protein